MTINPRILVPLLLPLALTAQRPWQQITIPTVREAAAAFRMPPDRGVQRVKLYRYR